MTLQAADDSGNNGFDVRRSQLRGSPTDALASRLSDGTVAFTASVCQNAGGGVDVCVGGCRRGHPTTVPSSCCR